MTITSAVYVITCLQADADVSDTHRVKYTCPVKPIAKPASGSQMQEPGRSMTVLAIIKDLLENRLALSGSHSYQSDHRVRQMGKDRTFRYK